MWLRSSGLLSAMTAVWLVTIEMAHQGGSKVPTIHIGTVDFSTGVLTAADVHPSKPIHGFAPLWNVDGTKLVYLSTTTDASGSSTTLNVETSGVTRAVVTDVAVGGTMTATRDPNVILVEGKNGKGEAGLFQINVLTGKATMLAAGARASFSNADGRTVYFFRGSGAHHELVGLELATGRQRTIIAYEHAPDIPESAYVSSDQSHVYYRIPAAGAKTPEPESRIIERDLRTGHERDLLAGRLGHLRPSPNGRYAVVRQVDPAGTWVAMRLLPLGGTEPVSDLMRAEGNAALFFSFWSRDSRSVVLQMPENKRPTSWWVSLANGQRRALSRFVGAAVVHPDGKTIAFVANDG